MFAVISLVGVVLLVSLSLALRAIFLDFARESAKQQIETQTSQTINTLSYELDTLASLNRFTGGQADILRYMRPSSGAFEEFLLHQRLSQYTRSLTSMNPNVDIYLFSEHRSEVFTSNKSVYLSKQEYQNLERESWYNRMCKQKEGFSLVADFTLEDLDRKPQIAFVSRVLSDRPNVTAGYVVTTVHSTMLKDIFKHSGGQRHVLMLLSQNQAVFSTDDTFSDQLNLEDFVVGDTAKPFSGDDGNEYYYTRTPVAGTPFDALVFLDNMQAKRAVNNMQITMWTLVGVVIVVLLLTARRFSASFTSTLYQLIKLVKRAEETNYTKTLDAKCGNELDILIEAVNDMIKKVYANQVVAKQMHIEVLQKQIAPHFLFNTMEIIKGFAFMHDETKVAETVDTLCDMFRYSINQEGNSIATLRQEIENVRCYLHIQKLRFEDRFHFEIMVEPHLMDQIVLKYILQPIVENAMLHSMEKSKSGFLILIEAHAVDNVLEIIVRDNGIGVPEDRLTALTDYLEQENPDSAMQQQFGIGLRNIHRKIQYAFGSDYGVCIESVQYTYTKVTVRLPSLR